MDSDYKLQSESDCEGINASSMVKVEINVDENEEIQIKNEQSDDEYSNVIRKKLRKRANKPEIYINPIQKIKIKKIKRENNKRYECQTCQKTFRHHQRLWAHREEHPYFSCYVCWKQFTTVELLENHNDEHSNQLYVCNHEDCEQRFDNCRAFVLHKKNEHEIINYLHCSGCDKTFHCHEQWDVSIK